MPKKLIIFMVSEKAHLRFRFNSGSAAHFTSVVHFSFIDALHLPIEVLAMAALLVSMQEVPTNAKRLGIYERSLNLKGGKEL
jgi:hypothetical protein